MKLNLFGIFSVASVSNVTRVSLSIKPPSITTESKKSLPFFCFLTLNKVLTLFKSIVALTYFSAKV